MDTTEYRLKLQAIKARVLGELKAEIDSGKPVDILSTRTQVREGFERKPNSDERTALLELYLGAMDIFEHSGRVLPEEMDSFKDATLRDYRYFLTQEAQIGQNVSVDLLYAATQREIQANRIAENDELCVLATREFSQPHLSVQQLLKIEQDRLAAETSPKGWFRWFSK
jgi:hypothetical protein